MSAAIAELTEGFSFAYLKEIFVTALLIIVGAQRGSNKEIENLPEPNGTGGKFDDVLLWRVIGKQVQTLRAEMEDALKSAEEAFQNSSSASASASKGAWMRRRLIGGLDDD